MGFSDGDGQCLWSHEKGQGTWGVLYKQKQAYSCPHVEWKV